MCHNDEGEIFNNCDRGKINLDLMESTLKGYENGELISVLQAVQGIYGYLPKEALEKISEVTGEKKSKIYGIATFYTQFRLKPLGKYVILQCQGTACYVNGAKEISKALCEELNINPGETTEDGLFSLEDVACLGCCSLAPVIMINGETYGRLTTDSAKKIIRNIYEVEKKPNS